MSRREQLAVAVLVLALLWFAWPARQVSADLTQQRAEALRGTSVEDLVKAVLAAPEGDLPPPGSGAGDLLEEALARHELQAGWAERACSVLDDDALAVVAVERAATGERSRSHPHTPPEMLRIVSLLVEAHGPAQVPVPVAPESSPLPGTPPEALASGLLALVESGQLGTDEARGVLAATLAGVRAHERAPELVEALEELLGERVVGLAAAAPGPRDRHELVLMGDAAVERLRSP